MEQLFGVGSIINEQDEVSSENDMQEEADYRKEFLEEFKQKERELYIQQHNQSVNSPLGHSAMIFNTEKSKNMYQDSDSASKF